MTSSFYKPLSIALLLFAGFARAQSFDFGVEVQQNYNSVEKFEDKDKYDPDNLAMSVVDLNLDTTNIYLSKFNMENNLSIPVYLRFNWRKRWG